MKTKTDLWKGNERTDHGREGKRRRIRKEWGKCKIWNKQQKKNRRRNEREE